jgi:hypothetical protein
MQKGITKKNARQIERALKLLQQAQTILDCIPRDEMSLVELKVLDTCAAAADAIVDLSMPLSVMLED